MKTRASGGTRKAMAGAGRHHRLGGLVDGMGGNLQLQQQQQCHQQQRRRRRLLLGAAGAAAALLLVGAVVAAGGKARHAAAQPHEHGAEQPPSSVQYEVASVLPASDTDAAALRVGPRAPPLKPTAAPTGEQAAVSSQEGVEALEEEADAAVSGAASVAAVVVDGHNNRVRIMYCRALFC
jgi:hypothetical protein